MKTVEIEYCTECDSENITHQRPDGISVCQDCGSVESTKYKICDLDSLETGILNMGKILEHLRSSGKVKCTEWDDHELIVCIDKINSKLINETGNEVNEFCFCNKSRPKLGFIMKYIKVSQAYFNYEKHVEGKIFKIGWPKNMDDIQIAAINAPYSFHCEKFELDQSHEPELIKKVSIGDILFRVNSDLTLTTVYHNVDSSD